MSGPFTTARAVGLMVLVAFALAACGGGGQPAADLAQLPQVVLPHLGEAAALQLEEIDGPVVINLWATWCAPCRRELPDFEQVHLELGDEVRFIGVNLGDRATDAARFISEVGVTFEQYLDADGTLNQKLGTATLPVTVITDNRGRIALVHSGPMDAQQLRTAIATARG
jgi:cytochrome c biogenesis protein CcmG, thiol:disulfide interchange protein DsbE